MSKIVGLNINLPEIEGVSYRQIQYAEDLREIYVTQNIDKFIKIEEQIELRNDYYIANGSSNPPAFDICNQFSREERACLFQTDAGGIIAALKDSIRLEVADAESYKQGYKNGIDDLIQMLFEKTDITGKRKGSVLKMADQLKKEV